MIEYSVLGGFSRICQDFLPPKSFPCVTIWTENHPGAAEIPEGEYILQENGSSGWIDVTIREKAITVEIAKSILAVINNVLPQNIQIVLCRDVDVF